MGSQSFRIGSIECRIVSDGTAAYPREQFFAQVPESELDPALRGKTNEQGGIDAALNCLLVRSGDKTIVIDTGLGELAQTFGAPAGRFRESIAALGVRPADVGTVIISHAHPDHIGGLTMTKGDGRAPVYAKARHYFSKTEWDFWTSEAGLGQVMDVMASTARTHLPPLRDAKVVEAVDGEKDVLEGIRLLPAPGHTPGHMAVAITSGREGLIYIGDAAIHELNFEHPEWLSVFDALPAVTVQTRKAMIERAVRERRLVISYHIPSAGRVERANGGYRFRAEAAAKEAEIEQEIRG